MALNEQVTDFILEVANLYDEVTTSDLQGIASVKAQNIINMIRTSISTEVSATPLPVTAAVESTQTNTCQIFNWNAKQYGGDNDSSLPFEMEITDHRKSSGQLYIDVAATNGNIDDLLCATIEIHRLPGSNDDTQCLHLHFDESNLAASFFKQADKFIIRLENDVSLRQTVLPNGERGWILE
jgi:hypothetical protein